MIELAARAYNKNIRWSRDPRSELDSITNGTFPVDPKMREVHNVNPHAYDIRSVFCPWLGRQFYSEEILSNYSRKYNLIGDDIYSLLCEYYLTDNFHRGFLHGCSTTNTSLHLVNVLDRDDVYVSYGSEGSYTPYTLPELTHAFTTTLSFSDGSRVFTEANIDYLVYLSLLFSSNRYKVSDLEKEAWISLRHSIYLVRERHSRSYSISQQLSSDLQGEDREVARRFLMMVFRVSMRMRGWTGSSMDDLSALPILWYKPCNASDIADRSIRRLVRMNNCSVTRRIMDIPLMRVTDGRVVVPDSPQLGLTLGDRINIVLERKSVHSCIVMSSNYLLVTSYVCLAALGITLPFRVEDMVHA